MTVAYIAARTENGSKYHAAIEGQKALCGNDWWEAARPATLFEAVPLDLRCKNCHKRSLKPVEHPLVTAYHAIFDAKDAAGPGNEVWDTAYEATKALAAFMEAIGVPAPRRFDAPRA